MCVSAVYTSNKVLWQPVNNGLQGQQHAKKSWTGCIDFAPKMCGWEKNHMTSAIVYLQIWQSRFRFWNFKTKFGVKVENCSSVNLFLAKLEAACLQNGLLKPGHSVVITSTCTMKSERYDIIGTRGKHNFETKFLEILLQFLVAIIIH